MQAPPDDLQPPGDAGDGPVRTGREGAGLVGLGCLAGLLAVGAGGGGAALFLGVSRIVRGSLTPLESVREAHALAISLETAVVLCAVGALGVLLGGVALVLILKELSDQSARRQRGPI